MQANHAGGFGYRTDKHRRVAALRRPAELLAEFGVGVWGVHHGRYTSPVNLPPGNLRRRERQTNRWGSRPNRTKQLNVSLAFVTEPDHHAISRRPILAGAEPLGGRGP